MLRNVLLSWPWRVCRWLFDLLGWSRRFWFPLFLALAGWLFWHLLPTNCEQEIRLTGVWLQLLGVGTVALRLQAAQRQFPGQWTEWLGRRPRLRPQRRILSATGFASGAGFFKPRVSLGPRPQSSLEERVEMLERGYGNLIDEVGGLEQKLSNRADEISTTLATETAERKAADNRNEELVKEIAVGGLHIDLSGVLFFLIGTVAGGASGELCWLLGYG
jgi:hypothetical protein